MTSNTTTAHKFKSLLPRTSSKLERALEQACADRCEAMGLNIQELYDADRCPLELLPFLAWAFQAPSWSATWTELQKRQAIKDAVIINRRKGTGWAVRMALGTANITAELIEWWQEAPKAQPYTFTTRVWLNNQLPSVFAEISAFKRLVDIVEEYKNVRSSFEVRIGAKFTQPLALGLAASMHATVNQQADTVPVPIRDSAVSLLPKITTSLHATVNQQADTAPVPIRDSAVILLPKITTSLHATANQQSNVAPVPLRAVAANVGLKISMQFRATMIWGTA